jgi:Asp/Glu/hydantoin racemase
MPYRLWNQSTTEMQRDGSYSQALIRRAATVLGPDVTIDTFGLPVGTYHGRAVSRAVGNAFVYHRILDRMIDQAIAADRQGYDGFVIGSFSEPFLTEIRSAVDIPVTSVLETTLLVGCSLGTKLAFITTSPNVDEMVRKAVAYHKMEARVAAVLSVEPALEGPVLHGAFDNPAPVLASFERAAERAIASGADVIIPAEGIIAIIVTEQGLTRFKDAPVIDVFSLTWRYAMMLADLKAKTGLGITRRGRFARPDMELIELVSRH